MTMRLLALATLVLTAAVAVAQFPAQEFTRPTVPPREVLERLNLKLGWRVYVPTEGRRDGLVHVENTGTEILVQTRSGLVTLLDAETGRALWRTRVGQPFRVSLPPTYNAKLVFVLNDNDLYGLDRKTGQVQWQYRTQAGPTAPVVADDTQLYACLAGGRAAAFELPKPGETAGPKPDDVGKDGKPIESLVELYSRTLQPSVGTGPYQSVRETFRRELRGPQPAPVWEFEAAAPLEESPLITGEFLLFAAADGQVVATSRFAALEAYRFATGGPISVAPGQFGDTAYVASRDFNLYAVNIPSGKVLWRLTGGSAATRRPSVTDSDVYVSTERGGLARLGRLDGDVIWRNTGAARFLAANPKFVYATDRSGRLLVLDRSRGTQLSVYNTTDYKVPVTNDWTDRIYLGAHDGLLICLHDRDYEAPQPARKIEGAGKPAAKPGSMPRAGEVVPPPAPPPPPPPADGAAPPPVPPGNGKAPANGKT